jgi:hypothetical protein
MKMMRTTTITLMLDNGRCVDPVGKYLLLLSVSNGSTILAD